MRRNKVISIITVTLFYLGLWVWSQWTIPLPTEITNQEIWAFVLMTGFATFGLAVCLIFTIKWLLGK